MSAAAPAPPPHLFPVSAPSANGYHTPGGPMPDSSRHGTGGSHPGSNTGSPRKSFRVFPHVIDLAVAAETNERGESYSNLPVRPLKVHRDDRRTC